MFGTNLLRIKGTISFCKHWTRKTNSSFECSNPRLEGQIGDGQGIVEQNNSPSIRMYNKLKEFAELLLDDTLFKV